MFSVERWLSRVLDSVRKWKFVFRLWWMWLGLCSMFDSVVDRVVLVLCMLCCVIWYVRLFCMLLLYWLSMVCR